MYIFLFIKNRVEHKYFSSRHVGGRVSLKHSANLEGKYLTSTDPVKPGKRFWFSTSAHFFPLRFMLKAESSRFFSCSKKDFQVCIKLLSCWAVLLSVSFSCLTALKEYLLLLQRCCAGCSSYQTYHQKCTSQMFPCRVPVLKALRYLFNSTTVLYWATLLWFQVLSQLLYAWLKDVKPSQWWWGAGFIVLTSSECLHLHGGQNTWTHVQKQLFSFQNLI